MEGIERIHGAGEVIVAAAGSAHAAWNASSDDEVHVLVDFRPALRTEIAFETLAGLARDGKTNKAGPPGTRCCWRSFCTTSRRRSTSSGPAGRPEDDLRGARQSRASARVSSRIPLRQAKRDLPGRDVI